MIDFLKLTENLITNPERTLAGVFVKVLVKLKYVIKEKKWKNNCSSISVI